MITVDTRGLDSLTVTKRAFWLAYQAGVPVGMGFLQATDKATEDDVWGFSEKPRYNGSHSADYVFGRMVKLNLTPVDGGVEVTEDTPRIDYQSWCSAYPTFADLVNAAVLSLTETPATWPPLPPRSWQAKALSRGDAAVVLMAPGEASFTRPARQGTERRLSRLTMGPSLTHLLTYTRTMSSMTNEEVSLEVALEERVTFLSIAKDAGLTDMSVMIALLWPLTPQGGGSSVTLESDDLGNDDLPCVPALIYRCAGIEILIHPETGVVVQEVDA